MHNPRLMIVPAVAAAVMLGGVVGSLVPTTMRMAEQPEWMQLPERTVATSSATYQFVESAPIDLSPEMAVGPRLETDTGSDFAMTGRHHVRRETRPVAYVPVEFAPGETALPTDDEASPAPAAAMPTERVMVHRANSGVMAAQVPAGEAAPTVVKAELATTIY